MSYSTLADTPRKALRGRTLASVAGTLLTVRLLLAASNHYQSLAAAEAKPLAMDKQAPIFQTKSARLGAVTASTPLASATPTVQPVQRRVIIIGGGVITGSGTLSGRADWTSFTLPVACLMTSAFVCIGIPLAIAAIMITMASNRRRLKNRENA